MAQAWLVLLGSLLAGYFVLGGCDLGAQMLAPALGRGPLAAAGPYVLGNEVWLVAAVGVLFGAFPRFEGELLTGLAPLVVVLLVALTAGTTAVQLRGRAGSASARRGAGRVAAVAGGVVAASWGAVVGVLLAGVPRGPSGYFTLTPSILLTPFVLLCAATAVLLAAAHGAAFVVLRTSGDAAARAARAAGRLLPAAAVAAGAGAVAGAVAVPDTAPAAVPLALLPVAGPLAAWVALRRDGHLRRGRAGFAFAATALAVAAPAFLLGAARPSVLLASTVDPRFSLTVADAAADGATLAVLGAFGVVLVPVIAAQQAWSWWLFRGRVDGTAPSWVQP